jgi:hypothetical protein
MKNLSHITHVWEHPIDLARDLGLPYTMVHSWERRGRIPPDHDLKIIAAAKARGEVITLEHLAHARQSPEGASA